MGKAAKPKHISAFPGVFLDVAEYLPPLDPLPSLSTLWALGRLTAATASAEVLWHVVSICIWPLRSPGRVWRAEEDKEQGICCLGSFWRGGDLATAERSRPLSSRLLQAQLAWLPVLLPLFASSDWDSVKAVLLWGIISCEFPEPCPWLVCRLVIKLSLIAPFGLHQFPVRTLTESPIQLTSLRKLQKLQRWITFTLKSGYPKFICSSIQRGFLMRAF